MERVGERKLGWVMLGVILLVCAVLGLVSVFGCDESTPSGSRTIYSSRSYKGHESDADINAFVRAYPSARGTRLDDCQTCHQGGSVINNKGKTEVVTACNYCHYILHPPTGYSSLPTTYQQTLNSYGVAFNIAGRSRAGTLSIGDRDSDGDGYSNSDEINDLRFPGSAASHPGLPQCSFVALTLDQVKLLDGHTQFGLANTSRQQFDFYATYKGVKIKDLLDSISPNVLVGASSIDVISPDGFAMSFSLAEVTNQFPPHRFYSGFGVADLGAACSFVEYPDNTYGYGYGDTITDEQWHILAYEREGQPLQMSYLDAVSGKIGGEGPFRNVIPPGITNGDSINPTWNEPDRGQNWDTTGCTLLPWNYVSKKDHNAGRMAKGVVIIRVRPIPAGCEEYDTSNGWSLIQQKKVVIFGHGIGP